MFTVSTELLQKAKSILSKYKHIYWIIGGSCSGKSTICKMIAKEKNIQLYDMDEHIFGAYMGRYKEDRHPASKAWFSVKNSLDWVLSLSWKKFENLNKAANVEYLDLFSEDVKKYAKKNVLLVDGGISYPSVLAQAFPIENIVCLNVPVSESRMMWENDEERKPMKEMILKLPSGHKKWETFLHCDKKIAEISLKESKNHDIKIFKRYKKTSVKKLAKDVIHYFGIL